MKPSKNRSFPARDTPPHIVTLVLVAGLPAAAMNIFLPSLPAMAAYFDTDYRIMQLAVPLYLGVNALMQLLIGPISDRVGRRPVLLTATVFFILFTIAIPFAPSAEFFLLLRMGQAVIIAGMVLSRAIVRDMVPQDEAASMIGYVTMGMALVPMLAPAFGGLLDQAFGWKANFVFLSAAGIALLWLVWADLGETAKPSSGSLMDQLRDAPELFKSPRFWGYNFSAMFAAGAFFAYLGGAPFVGSVIFDLSPAILGLVFGAPALGYMTGNAISGLYSRRFGINAMILTGTLITTTALSISLVLSYNGWHSAGVFFGFNIFVGLGNGLVMPNATAGMLSVRPKLAGTASGLGGAMMIGGGAVLSSLAASLLTPGAGAFPLIWTMLASSSLSILAILYVLKRNRQVQPFEDTKP